MIGFGTTFGVSTSDNIIIPTNGQTQVSTGRTFFVRYMFNARGGANLGAIFRKCTPTITTNISSLGWDGTAVSYGEPYSGTTGQFTITGGNALNTVFNLVIVSNPVTTSSKPTIYVNGSTVSVTTSTTPVGSSSTNLSSWCLGNRGTDLTHNFDGLIGPFAQWDALLVQSEVTQLQAGVSPLFIQPNLLRVYWPGVDPRVEVIGGSACVTGCKPFDGKDLYTIQPEDSY